MMVMRLGDGGAILERISRLFMKRVLVERYGDSNFLNLRRFIILACASTMRWRLLPSLLRTMGFTLISKVQLG
ncbi:hypothetical protein RB24_10220 [Herbaspirillum rubrisubalbicans]|uniref:Transposase n=1 Tax=Herbaspirillum rubrisubalbicans TaxID=80842 RepID=A0ABX9C3S9_9BURK|nr:hypothetical protein RB24_10220 [Herbaspirillum rubrisubalbicans]